MEVRYEDIVKIYELEVKRNTKSKHKIYRFEMYKVENLIRIYNLLKKYSKRSAPTIEGVPPPKYIVLISSA